MPARLRYEGTGLLVPKDVIAEKEEQLRYGIDQFMRKYPPFSSGLFIVFKWAFILPHSTHKKDIILFRVELLNLSSGETQVRAWEMKDQYLISETVFNHPRPFVLTGYLFADWYQDLFGLALYEKKNRSVEKVLENAYIIFKLSSKDIEIKKASCRINLAWGKEYGGLEYKLKAKAYDSSNKLREYNWLLETDPLEERYLKVEKASVSPKRIPDKTRANSAEVPEELSTTLKAFRITNYKGSNPKANLQVIGNNPKSQSSPKENKQGFSPVRPKTPMVMPVNRLFTPLKNTFFAKHQLNFNTDPKEFLPIGGTEITVESPKKTEGSSPVFVPGRIRKAFRLFNTPNGTKNDLNRTFGIFS